MRKLNIGDSMIINGGSLKGRKGYITEIVQMCINEQCSYSMGRR